MVESIVPDAFREFWVAIVFAEESKLLALVGTNADFALFTGCCDESSVFASQFNVVVLRLGVSRCANGTSTNGGACLTNIGNMTMNGTVSVFLGDSYSLVEGDSVILWTAEKNLGTPKLENYIIDEAAGLYWDDSQLARGVLYVTKEIPAGIHGIYYTNDEDAGWA